MDSIAMTVLSEQQKWNALTPLQRRTDYLPELLLKDDITTTAADLCVNGSGSKDLIAIGSVLSSQQKWSYLTATEKMSWMLESLKKAGITATAAQICEPSVIEKAAIAAQQAPSPALKKYPWIPLVLSGIVISIIIIVAVKVLSK